ILVVAIAAVVVTFSLVASKALWDQSRFLSRVIDKKETARDQLVANVEATNQLVTSYKEFVRRQPNVIDGDANGQGANGGDNAQIVLDALPSKYDHAALLTSIEKLITDLGLGYSSVTSEDMSIEQAG